MKEYPSTEELRKVFDYVDGCLYWKIKPAACISIGMGYYGTREEALRVAEAI